MDKHNNGHPIDTKTNGAGFLKNSPAAILSALKGLWAKPISGLRAEDADPKTTSKKKIVAMTIRIGNTSITTTYSNPSGS